MKKYIGSLLMCFTATLAAAQIYQWTDRNGEMHFSDTPQKGAKRINLPPVQTFPAPQVVTPVDNSDTQEEKKKNTYKSISIIEPANESTSRDNQGRVPVLVETSPPLKPGDKIQILLDGKPIGKPQDSTSFLLSNVLRGEHTITAAIVNEAGDSLLKSKEPILLFMHRPRTGMTNNTPAPRGGGR